MTRKLKIILFTVTTVLLLGLYSLLTRWQIGYKGIIKDYVHAYDLSSYSIDKTFNITSDIKIVSVSKDYNFTLIPIKQFGPFYRPLTKEENVDISMDLANPEVVAFINAYSKDDLGDSFVPSFYTNWSRPAYHKDEPYNVPTYRFIVGSTTHEIVQIHNISAISLYSFELANDKYVENYLGNYEALGDDFYWTHYPTDFRLSYAAKIQVSDEESHWGPLSYFQTIQNIVSITDHRTNSKQQFNPSTDYGMLPTTSIFYTTPPLKIEASNPEHLLFTIEQQFGQTAFEADYITISTTQIYTDASDTINIDINERIVHKASKEILSESLTTMTLDSFNLSIIERDLFSLLTQ